ncbi:MAG: arylsulfatase B [Opitutia bacterium]
MPPRCLLLAFCLVLGLSAAEPPTPNVLLIVADDMGWADVSWHGGRFRTPRMAELLKTSVELDRHYVQPVCTPTRTALLSGRWTSRFGPHVLGPTNLRAFPEGTFTLAVAMKSAGYRTAIAGKWHLGGKFEWGPRRHGFDESYGFLTGAVDPWTHKYRKGDLEDTWNRNDVLVKEEGNATELIAAEAERQIRAQRGPWFVYVPFGAVHIPIDAPPEYFRAYADVRFSPDPVKDDSMRRYAAFVSQLDAKVGQLVDALKATGQLENTLIIFTSDNGGIEGGGNPYVGTTKGSPAVTTNAPLRGWKNQPYEGGMRVNAFVSWPGRLPAGKCVAPMHAADWMPTLCRLVGARVPADVRFDGMDVWPALSGAEPRPAPRTIYVPHYQRSAVFFGDWKLIVPHADPQGKAELYDLAVDPSEQHDLAAEQPAKLAEMRARFVALKAGDLPAIPAGAQLKHSPAK